MVRILSFCLKSLRHKTCGYVMFSLVLLGRTTTSTFCINPLYLTISKPDERLRFLNDVTYPSGYYLVDGIYPELVPLVKTIPEPADEDHKRIFYKQKQESARKDVERAFGVLKKKWAILVNPTRALRKDRIMVPVTPPNWA
ncbi:serine/threonine-protein kinase STY17-like protein [Tanacetum coccineum]